MAETRQFNTRLLLKYDSYENWAKATNVELLAGEIAIAYLGPTVDSTVEPNNGTHPVLFKVGPGKFNNLPWASALAADVYDWAKAESVRLNGQTLEFHTGNTVIHSVDLSTFLTVDEANAAYKKVQTAKQSPSANGSALAFIDSISQDAQGVITATKKNVNLDDYAKKTDLPTNFGVLSVAADDKTLTISPNKGDVKAKVNISTASGNILTLDSNGLYVPAPEAAKDWSDEIADALAEAKQYADDNDADTNTAHTHAAGDGLKLTGNGGISGETKYELNLALKLENGSIVLHDKTNASKIIAALDAAELLEDSYLNDVDIEGNNLMFTWKMDDGSTKTDSVDLTHLVDVYTGEADGTVKVDVANYKISAEVIANSLTNTHIAANAAIAETKLEQNAQNALALARTALQAHQDISGKKDKQSAIADQNLSGATVVKGIAQDANGVITVSTRNLTPADIGAAPAGNYQPAGSYATSTELANAIKECKEDASNKDVVVLKEIANHANDSDLHLNEVSAGTGLKATKTGTSLNVDFDDEVVFIFYCGDSKTLIE